MSTCYNYYRDWISSIQEAISKVYICMHVRWKTCINRSTCLACMQVGTPSDDCSSDAQSKTEKKISKAMRSGAKIMNRVAKKFSKQKGNECTVYNLFYQVVSLMV